MHVRNMLQHFRKQTSRGAVKARRLRDSSADQQNDGQRTLIASTTGSGHASSLGGSLRSSSASMLLTTQSIESSAD